MTTLSEIAITDGYTTTIGLNNAIVAANTSHTMDKIQISEIGVMFTTLISGVSYTIFAPWANVSNIDQTTSDTTTPLSFDELEFSGSGNDVYGNFVSGGASDLSGTVDVKEEGVWRQSGASINLFPWNTLHGLYQEA
jgi:hypothetical protein